jgi:xanthosine utilization system XapX-like protein
MSRKNHRKKPGPRAREFALVADDPAMMTILGLRAWLPRIMADATYRLLFASGFVAATIFAWPYVPKPAVPFVTLFAITLGALVGKPIDDWIRRRRAARQQAASRSEDKQVR